MCCKWPSGIIIMFFYHAAPFLYLIVINIDFNVKIPLTAPSSPICLPLLLLSLLIDSSTLRKRSWLCRYVAEEH